MLAKDSDNDEGRTSPDTDNSHFIRPIGNPDAVYVVGQVCHVSEEMHAPFVTPFRCAYSSVTKSVLSVCNLWLLDSPLSAAAAVRAIGTAAAEQDALG